MDIDDIPRTAGHNERRAVITDAIAVGAAVGVYGLAFGAAATTAGLSPVQASALSLFTFTGASQFALVGVLGAGGSVAAAVAVAVALGLRNGLYGLRLTKLLPSNRLRRAVAAHLVIDESMAMAVAREDPALARLGFWATGLSVFFFWNLATLIGALGALAVADPAVIGFDAVFPAAFLALLAPMLRGRTEQATALAAVAITVTMVALGAPAGLPILAAALAATPALWSGRRRSEVA